MKEKIDKRLEKWLHCNLLHKKVAKFTGKKIWNKYEKAWAYEIIYVCKEGCGKSAFEGLVKEKFGTPPSHIEPKLKENE